MALQVLLIESDPGLAEEVRRAFGPAGFDVLTLDAGEHAVERVREGRPDLVLLCAELPDMSGFSVCNRLKRAHASVPLILYTSEATPAAIEAHRATPTRADAYLRKPLDMADLLGQAAQLLHAAPAPAGPPSPPSLRPAGAAEPQREGQPARPRPAPSGPPRPPTLSPPPVPQAAAAAAVARPKAPPAPVRAEVPDPFADAPRDPPPPKGTPEEKLEFFRERLRARDAFVARVREAFGQAKAEADRMAASLEATRSRLAAEEARREEAERLAAERGEALARASELEGKLRESEATRQSLSNVLSESIQAQEAAEQQWALRLSAAEEERARVETLRREEAERSEGERREQAEGFESERADLARQLEALRSEHDEVSLGARRLAAQLEAEAAARREDGDRAERELAAARAEASEVRGRCEALAEELADARGHAEALEAELGRREKEEERLEGELRAARAEANALGEKAVATEQTYLAQSAELESARRRAAELAAALDAGRASAEGVKGEVAHLQEELGQLTRRVTQVSAERDQLGRELEAERRARDQSLASMERLRAEAGKAEDVKAQAAEAGRLRRELAHAQELLQQRTHQAESASRSAHDASSERERLRERLELENERLQSELARRDQEVAALQRRMGELSEERGTHDSQAQRASAELDAQRRARAEDAVESEKRHLAEVQRLKAALVDLERRLEGVARAESQARKKVAEMEKRGGGGDEVARLRERLGVLEEELEDLKGENDFLNGEVARYQQKNKDLQAELESLKQT